MRKAKSSRLSSAARTCVLLVAFAAACGGSQRPDGGHGLLKAGVTAPEFSCRDDRGRLRKLADFRGRPVVLYFYPKDGTPGCTTEACAFRDAWTKLSETGAQVVGVSRDDVASHAKFVRDEHLPFPLLADPQGHVLAAYGVKSTLGYAQRVTFVIDRRGVIASVFPDVDPAVHVTEVLDVLRRLPR